MEMLKSKSHPNAVYHPPRVCVMCTSPDRKMQIDKLELSLCCRYPCFML